ncbi:MAG: hypothetical protein AVDCRST_MAG73-1841 [uncultured Thermomicrobiales bacterium]|uniref:VOC domain-containing protein n=1 Tax=uncultured Thermomicrobiales bacterium TaxID=1645740 RepID=A0A6J4U7R4_9BACT|nr:MAG: hypothetical protein AVDCRST_MAG73-1841 [uncultured Thermomicrobiales bacterium]
MESTGTPEPPSVPPSPIVGFYELALEVADLEESERFYHDLLGLPVVDRWSGERRATVLGLGGNGFLLLWPPETGGAAAIHGGRGGSHVHFALRIPPEAVDPTRARLEALGVPVETFVFERGDRALYLDDPDGNVVELSGFVTFWDGTSLGTPAP